MPRTRTASPSAAVTTPSTAPRFPIGFRADIQGLRAVAVVSVILYHVGLPGFDGGYVGVDVFFVISGFLISAHLLRATRSETPFSFADFYARRIRRILPAAMTVIALTVIAVVVLVPPLRQPVMWNDALATILYVPNFVFASNQIDYLSSPVESLFKHFWSLAVEEQFYLVWPVVIVVSVLLSRRSVRALALILTAVVAISFVACVVLTSRSQPWAFYMMPTRAWEFGIGALIALLITTRAVAIPRVAREAMGWTGLALLLGAVLLFSSSTQFPGSAAALPVAGTALMILSGSGETGPVSSLYRTLSVPPALFLGAISYSLYLVHWPMLYLPQVLYSEWHDLPLWVSLLLALVSVPIAWVIYRVIESPARTAGVLTNRTPWLTIGLALALTGLLAGVAGVGAGAARSAPMSTSQIAAAPDLSAGPDPATVVPANLTPTLPLATADNPDVYPLGCHLDVADIEPVACTSGPIGAATSVVLFGDSHAAQWHPALDEIARDGDIHLVSHTKSSCPPFELRAEDHDRPYPQCVEWRESVVESMIESPPDIVILTAFAEGDMGGIDESQLEAWGSAVRSVVARLSSVTDVVVLADTPHFEIPPPVCLSGHLNEAQRCAGDPASTLQPALRELERTATAAGGGRYVDLTDRLCSDSGCPAVMGNVLVYRDTNHLTATMSALLAPYLSEALFISGR